MKLNKKLITISLVILVFSIVGKLIYLGFRQIKLDNFVPMSVIFLMDSSASNQKNLPEQKKTLKQICNMLDPEDQIKIIKISEEAYLIYEGSPMSGSDITKSLDEFTKYDAKDYGTAYGSGLTKALTYSLSMQELGYMPAIVIIGDLENEGAVSKQINWNTLQNEISEAKSKSPAISMLFLGAHPEKLDKVKEILTPVLGENKLIISSQIAADKSIRRFLTTIGR